MVRSGSRLTQSLCVVGKKPSRCALYSPTPTPIPDKSMCTSACGMSILMGKPALTTGLNAVPTEKTACTCMNNTVTVVATEKNCTDEPVIKRAKADVSSERTGAKATDQDML